MKRFQKSKFIVMTSSFLLLIVALLYLSGQTWFKESKILEPVNHFTATIDGWLAKPTAYISQKVSDFELLLDAYEENKVLKNSVSELKQVLSENEELVAENASLRQALSLSEKQLTGTKLNAEVIYRHPNTWSGSLTVDKGDNENVTPHMFALANGGLIGTVSEIGTDRTKIDLLTDVASQKKIAVKILGETPVYGILTDYDSSLGVYIVTQLNQEAEISEGTSVITSDLSDNLAANLLVGEVVAVKKNSNSLDTELHVKPAADFSNIYTVVLVGK